MARSSLSNAEEARRLELSDDDLALAMEALTALARRFVADAPRAKAYAPAVALPSAPIVEEAAELRAVLEEAFHALTGRGVTATSGRFFGFIPGGGLTTAALGDFIAALLNSYSGMHGAAPGAAEIENTCVRFLIGIFGMPDTAWGSLLSGGTVATLTALVVARDRLGSRHARDGAVAYMTTEAHLCARKALKTIGMGDTEIRLVAIDAERRMKPDALAAAIAEDRAAGKTPWLLFASAGTTNTGAVDPLDALGAVARAHGLWFHVDAAYGGGFALTDRGRARLRGIGLADSIVTDPHKGLFLPYGIGACLVRDGEALRASFAVDADYLAGSHGGEDERSPSEYSPELTRHFRGLRLWLSLRVHGVARFRCALDEKLDLAADLSEALAALPGLEVYGSPELTVVAFRCAAGEDATQALLARVLARGEVHISSTRLDGSYWLRACVLAFRTHREDVERLVQELAR